MESGLILVVDDELSIRRALHTTLSNLGFRTVEAARGEEALSLVRTNIFDAVLLDINMPGMSGIDACKIMRSRFPRIPILMLTVRDSEDDKVEALDAGADDFITKPFQLRELTARIPAAMRWSKMPDTLEAAVLRINEIELDPVRHTVKKAGQLIHLTPKEFELTHHLMTHAGRPIQHSRLLSTVWGEGYGNGLEYLRTFMRQLRKKLEDDPATPSTCSRKRTSAIVLRKISRSAGWLKTEHCWSNGCFPYPSCGSHNCYLAVIRIRYAMSELKTSVVEFVAVIAPKSHRDQQGSGRSL